MEGDLGSPIQNVSTPRTPLKGSTPSAPIENTPRLGLGAGVARLPDRTLVDARFMTIGPSDRRCQISTLCLIVVLDSSDVIVYHLSSDAQNNRCTAGASAESNTDCDLDTVRQSFFVKVEHSIVTRKRKNRARRRNPLTSTINGDASASTSSSSSLMTSTGLKDATYVRDFEDMNVQRIKELRGMDGSISALVSGSRPLVVRNDSGVPFIGPLGSPELPFSNSGTYLLAPLCVGQMKGMASLWTESDDCPSSGTDSRKQGTLQLYQEIPGLICYPGSITTAKKTHSGVTTHHCTELMGRSEDSTEQALLKRRTFVLACSTEKKVPFLYSVLTNEEKEKEETFYDRFFSNLESFAQPDPNTGAAPELSIREYKLVIMQSGAAVDEYVFPLGEQVLGIEPLYLTVSTVSVVPALYPLAQSVVVEKKVKRVFLAACTCVEDKHGEDTQGEGRLMLFGLDYALFQDAVLDTAESKEAEEIDENETAATAPSSSSSTATTSLSAILQTIATAQNKSLQSSEQAKFFKAIQPKLKLLWTGPGPASIVKQIGEYILSTVGTTIYVYKLNSETMELDQITFYFAQVHYVCFCSYMLFHVSNFYTPHFSLAYCNSLAFSVNFLCTFYTL